MSQEAILYLDVLSSTKLKKGSPKSAWSKLFQEYNSRLATAMHQNEGVLWSQSGDGVIYTFPNCGFAVQAALALANHVSDINRSRNPQCKPITLRIGITPGHISRVPTKQRAAYADPQLDLAGHLQNRCPPGKILISRKAYEEVGTIRPLFRYGPRLTHGDEQLETYVSASQQRGDNELLIGLSDTQREAIPTMPFPDWEDLKPPRDVSLKTLKSFFDEDVLAILGESRGLTHGQSHVTHPATTSDAVGVCELISGSGTTHDVIICIDEWVDTQDYATDRNIIVVGSGIVNTYAYSFNDLMRPLRFDRHKSGNVIQLIIGKDGKRQFGHHAPTVDDRHAGLLLLCRNPFNVDRLMLWIAGISGLSTSAAARLARDFVKRPEGILPVDCKCESPIGCVVVSRGPPNAPPSTFWARWRLTEYSLVWMVDNHGVAWPS
jgi:class 3 adenylate cyclase